MNCENKIEIKVKLGEITKKRWIDRIFFICGHPRTSLTQGIEDPLHVTVWMEGWMGGLKVEWMYIYIGLSGCPEDFGDFGDYWIRSSSETVMLNMNAEQVLHSESLLCAIGDDLSYGWGALLKFRGRAVYSSAVVLHAIMMRRLWRATM